MVNVYTKLIDGVWSGTAIEKERVFATSFNFIEEAVLCSLLKSISFRVPFQNTKNPSVFAECIIALLKKIYDGREVSGCFALATEHLSNYTKKTLEITSSIPLGCVSSYGSLASVIGDSSRAIGRVMSINPFVLIVPCHRVVRSDFKLSGYGKGLITKRKFLERERRGYSSKNEIFCNGKKLSLFPVEFVLERLEKGKF